MPEVYGSSDAQEEFVRFAAWTKVMNLDRFDRRLIPRGRSRRGLVELDDATVDRGRDGSQVRQSYLGRRDGDEPGK
jgi:hypothetical protein